jgi:glycosyltransferase involved in cell wall biosynthesis
MKTRPIFTVFTPTYNRKKYLKLAFNSLNKQKLFNLFEWLIIDDGSVDGTSELIKRLKKNSKFEINYFYQPNSGKHIAHNNAISKANGKLMIFLDSDDKILPGSINYLYKIWNLKTNIQKNEIAGFLAHSVNKKKKIIGKKWPPSLNKGYLHELLFNNLLIGEKMPIYRVDILKKYLFPKKKIFKFIPEGVAWLEISKYHKVELLNRPMRYYYENDKGLMSINKKFTKNLEGKILLNRKLEFFIERYFLNNIILVTNILVHKAVLALLINRNFFQIEKFSIFIRIFYFILIPLSLIKFFIIKLKK